MTHQLGGGIPHAWLLTKHEMFMLSVCGRVCGYACFRKSRDKVYPLAVPPTFSCILASQHGTEGGCCPLTEDTDIEQDKTLTFHQHLSSPLPFLTLSFLSFDMAQGFPRAVAHSLCAGGSATSWRHSHIVMAHRAK